MPSPTCSNFSKTSTEREVAACSISLLPLWPSVTAENCSWILPTSHDVYSGNRARCLVEYVGNAHHPTTQSLTCIYTRFSEFHRTLLFCTFEKPRAIYLIITLIMIDLIRLFFKRILIKKNPLTPDRFHLHHLLLLKYSYFKSLLILYGLITFPLVMNYFNINKMLIIIFFILIYSMLLKIVLSKN